MVADEKRMAGRKWAFEELAIFSSSSRTDSAENIGKLTSGKATTILHGQQRHIETMCSKGPHKKYLRAGETLLAVRLQGA